MLDIVNIGCVGAVAVCAVFTVGFTVSNKSKANNYVTKDDCRCCNEKLNESLQKIIKDLNTMAIMVARIDERLNIKIQKK